MGFFRRKPPHVKPSSRLRAQEVLDRADLAKRAEDYPEYVSAEQLETLKNGPKHPQPWDWYAEGGNMPKPDTSELELRPAPTGTRDRGRSRSMTATATGSHPYRQFPDSPSPPPAAERYGSSFGSASGSGYAGNSRASLDRDQHWDDTHDSWGRDLERQYTGYNNPDKRYATGSSNQRTSTSYGSYGGGSYGGGSYGGGYEPPRRAPPAQDRDPFEDPTPAYDDYGRPYSVFGY